MPLIDNTHWGSSVCFKKHWISLLHQNLIINTFFPHVRIDLWTSSVVFSPVAVLWFRHVLMHDQLILPQRTTMSDTVCPNTLHRRMCSRASTIWPLGKKHHLHSKCHVQWHTQSHTHHLLQPSDFKWNDKHYGNVKRSANALVNTYS